MAKLTVDQMVQLANQTKSQSNNQKTMSVDEMVALAKSSKPVKDLGTLPPMKSKAEIGEPSKAKSFILGAVNEVGGGINQLVSGAKDLGSSAINKLLGTDLKADRYKEVTRETKAVDSAYEKSRAKAGQVGSDGWRTAGSIVGSIPFGVGGIGKNVATTAIKSGGLGTLIGGAQFAENAEQRKSNAIAGGVGGAAGGVIGKKIGDGITRVVNAKKGNYKGGVKEVLDQAEKHGIRTSVGDLGRNPLVQKTEVTMESIPLVGMEGFRKAQQKETKLAADKIIENLRDKMSDVDYKSLNKIQAAADGGDRNAIRIMGIVKKAGDDSGKILQAAAEIKNWRGQQIASQLYDRVDNLAQKQGGVVTPTNTLDSINTKIANESKSLAPDKVLLSELTDIQQRLSDPAITSDFANMRLLRSQLGDLQHKFAQGSNANKTASKYFGDLRASVEDDISNYAQGSGSTELKHAYKKADYFYKNLQSTKESAYTRAMGSSEPDQIFDQFTKAGKGDRAANFYRSLDPKGQAALRYQMAQNAMDKAWNANKEVFSPAIFAREFERLSAPYENIFKGGDKAQMDGFVKLMRHIERAGQYAENPPTGNRTVGILMGGAAAVNLPLAIKAASASAVAKILFTTNAGKRILLAAKDLPPNSPKLANLLKQAQQLATASGANATN